MRRLIIISFLLLSLWRPCFSEPYIYASPGFQMMYRPKEGLSYGLKISLGTLISNRLACNMSMGVMSGDRSEAYVELQAMPFFDIHDHLPVLTGTGLGVSFLNVNRADKLVIRPRISVFTGLGLFLNSTYIFSSPDDMSGYQFGTTLAMPVPLRETKFDNKLRVF